jgi:sugar lactone lactonase YvrE
VAARLSQSPGNITVTPGGRMIVSIHPRLPAQIRVAEVTGDTLRPFPNAAWNTPRPGTEEYLDSVLGLRSDENGVVWMLDLGMRAKIRPKIVGWNTRTDRLERVYYLPGEVLLPTSEPNDLVVDLKNGVFYIADEGAGMGGDGTQAALIVIDMRTGSGRRLLNNHRSTRTENVPVHVEGRDLVRTEEDGRQIPHRVGADGLALDHAMEWLYYGPLTGRRVYRVRTADLLDRSLDDRSLGAKVETYAEKPVSGGMSIDAAGNLYLTEVESAAVGVIPAKGRRYRRHTGDEAMFWPDGLSYAPDGSIYVTADQLPRAAVFNAGVPRPKPPFLIYRFRPLAPGRIGH